MSDFDKYSSNIKALAKLGFDNEVRSLAMHNALVLTATCFLVPFLLPAEAQLLGASQEWQ